MMTMNREQWMRFASCVTVELACGDAAVSWHLIAPSIDGSQPQVQLVIDMPHAMPEALDFDLDAWIVDEGGVHLRSIISELEAARGEN